MKILVIDDNRYKISWIIVNLVKTGLVQEDDIQTENYGCIGMKAILDNQYDLLVLDMQFPWRIDSRIEPDCGMRILRELERRESDLKTIICSSEQIALPDQKNVVGFILYDNYDASGKFKDIMIKY